MKIIKYPVQIFHNSTLKKIGSYGPNRIAIIGDHEIVLDFFHHKVFWGGLISVLMMSLILNIKAARDYSVLSEENTVLKESIELVTVDHNVELLAGRYATSKSPIPKDKEEIFKFCVESGAWYPDIIMAQLILESSCGKSDVYRHSRNLYGMKKIGEGQKSRPNLQIPGMDYHGYGIYLNWQHSILDRVLWERWMFAKTGRPADRWEYYAKINGIYAEDPDYIEKISRIAKEWESKIDSIVPIQSIDSLFE